MGIQFDSKFPFCGKFRINLKKKWDPFILNIHTLTLCLIHLFNKSILPPMNVCKIE